MYIYIYIRIYTHIYIYIYAYIHPPSDLVSGRGVTPSHSDLCSLLQSITPYRARILCRTATVKKSIVRGIVKNPLSDWNSKEILYDVVSRGVRSSAPFCQTRVPSGSTPSLPSFTHKQNIYIYIYIIMVCVYVYIYIYIYVYISLSISLSLYMYILFFCRLPLRHTPPSQIHRNQTN